MFYMMVKKKEVSNFKFTPMVFKNSFKRFKRKKQKFLPKVISKKIKVRETYEPSRTKKYLTVFVAIVSFLILVIAGIYILSLSSKIISTCGDGTFYDNCSLNKPYFCLNGILVKNAFICGCPEVLSENNGLCVSKYQTNPKNITLKYVLRGEEDEIDLVVYGGMVDYIMSLSKFIYYSGEEKPSRRDFKIRNINEKEQRELLLPLVTKIQNIAESKEDQARIAVSIVQNIPFGGFGEIVTIRDYQLNYSQYPYEVLYNGYGVCGEKFELLAFLLKEIGYGVVLFYYPVENHEALGIKCPIEYSLNNISYCFIETTGPSIITNNQNEYIGVRKLSSEPEVILISEGDFFGEDFYEYKDAKDWIKINEVIKEKGKISWIDNFKFEKIKKKYMLSV